MSAPTPDTTPRTPAARRYGPGALLLTALLGAGLATAVTLHLTASRAPGAPGDASTHAPEPPPAPVERFQCPMHPNIVQDHPGDCPVCGMRLVKLEAPEAEAAEAEAAERTVRFYRSATDPHRTSPLPRKDEDGTDYVPVYADELAGLGPIEGMASVDIDPQWQQLIGLKTAEVTLGPVGRAWRTAGRVAIDETRVRHVNLKVSGFVEKVYVDFVGKQVARGDPLFTIYSPELLAAQEELLLALRATASGPAGPGAAGGGALAAAARRKLALWDVPASLVTRLVEQGKPTKTLTLYSPVAGVVTRKDVVEGMKLDAGAMPYEIVDLSSVWVLADVYERELRFVREGMAATLTLSALPNRVFEGHAVFVAPILDAATRTVKVRLTFPNPRGELRPEMFGEVVFSTTPRDALRIPRDAVLDSGTEQLVFVATGRGKFSPRRVALGESDAVNVEVVAGLVAGERVVTHANFLVDSESRLRGSLAAAPVAPPPRAPDAPDVADASDDTAPPAPPPAAPHRHGP